MATRRPHRAGSRSAAPVHRPRILAFAHGCSPGIGSEAGVGWAWARLLATIGPTTVIARAWEGDRARVAEALAGLPPDQRPRIVWVEAPSLPGSGRRTHASTRLQRLEYVLWQVRALAVARRLHRRNAFDLAWHLAWANAWIGSTACLVGPPFVYGPVGGGVTPPWRLVAHLGATAGLTEVVRVAVRATARYLNPLARVSWQRAALILVQNPETRDWFPPRVRGRAVVFPNALLDAAPGGPPQRGAPATRTALFAGRLVAWKGGSLAIETIARAPGWRLVICGDGPDGPRLRALAGRLGVAGRVEFRGQVGRELLLRTMAQEADAFLFPSLRDEGPWAVAEAVMAGLPVVCLDVGGPPVLAGWGVTPGDHETTVRALADALRAAGDGDPRPGRPTDPVSRRAALVRQLEAAGLLAPAGDPPGAVP